MIWRVVGTGFMLFFAACTVLQINDPDPMLWIALYGGAALVCLPVARGRPSPRWAPLIMMVLASELALMDVMFPPPPEIRADDTMWGTEQAREVMGALLVCSWCAVVYFAQPFSDDADIT